MVIVLKLHQDDTEAILQELGTAQPKQLNAQKAPSTAQQTINLQIRCSGYKFYQKNPIC